MKKILTFILSAVLLLSVIPFNTFNVNAETETGKFENFTYQISYGTITITGYEYDGSEPAEVIIPSEIAGCPVTAIYYLDIVSNKNIKSIYIPKSVTTITNYNYLVDPHYISLESIEVEPGNPIYHSSGNCIIQTAEKQLIFGSNKSAIPSDGSVVFIGYQAFSGCRLLESITIPDVVTYIGADAFYCCNSLKSIIIPDGVTRINVQTFSFCSSLKNIIIPDSVTSIGDYAFYGCSSLEIIAIPSSVASIGGSAFSGCNSLKNITIPDSVASIGGSAFNGCRLLKSISLPENVTSIGDYAFYDCS